VVTFDSGSHTYTNIKTGEKYVSVTTLLGKYKPKFDDHLHAERVAKRDGCTKHDILDKWEKIRTAATDKGTLVHNLLEDYIKTGRKPDKAHWLFDEFSRLISENTSYIKTIYGEELLYNHDYKVAGTSDVVIDGGKYFHMADFKTNKAFNYYSKYNEYFSDPVSHLSVCEFNVYSLQLSMYAFMYEKMTNKKLKSVFVMFLRPDKKTFNVINMNYMKTDVENIFKNYKLNLLKG